MANWNLSEIRQQVRQVTGRLSEDQFSDAQLLKRINWFTKFKLPAELKLEKQHVFYEFLTTENQAYYAFDAANYTNIEPNATIDNLSLEWYQSPDEFYNQNPYQISRSTPWTGNGVITAFSTTVQSFPIFPGTLVITDETELFEDTNNNWSTANQVIAGSLGGSATINYDTGAISVTFNTAPANGQNISLSYTQFNPGRPISVLFYNDQFEFYPPPNTAYRFKAKAYGLNLVRSSSGTSQTEFLISSDVPARETWGPMIVFGTARQIFTEYGEMDAYAEATAVYREHKADSMNETHQNLLNTRAQPQF